MADAHNGKNRRILLIDDNRAIHDDFRKILTPTDTVEPALEATEAALFGSVTEVVRQTRFEVDSAYQGRDGASLVREALEEGRPYAMAFVDVRMPPGWDGMETTREIWKIDPNVQIVICTAYSDYSLGQMFNAIGWPDNFVILKKPFDTVEALQLAHSLTDKWNLARQYALTLRELESRVTELAQKNIDLERAMQAKDMFLANMSHELRTPLSAIIGFTGTLLMKLPGTLTGKQEEQLTIVQANAKHLLSLINDLLDLSKIESGKLGLKPESLSCEAIAQDAIASLRPMAERKRLTLNLQLPAKAFRVTADRRALHQILLNLCNNAIKFTDSGAVTVELKELPQDRELEFSVTDTGIGIQPEYQDKLFQAFSQMDSTHREGTGLGLHLSRKLAELIGGRIDFESQLGQGSRFWLTLPLEQTSWPAS